MKHRLGLVGAIVFAFMTTGNALAAAPVDRFQDRYDFFEYDRTLCDLVLTIHYRGSLSVVVRADDTGTLLGTASQFGDYTLINEANGKVLVNLFAGSVIDHSVVDNGDGTVTFTYAIAGVNVFRDPSGAPIVEDTGRIIYADTIDLNGTPDDPSDDFLSSSEIAFIAGQQDFPTGGSLCTAVRAALS
jgi:hypothetical protein